MYIMKNIILIFLILIYSVICFSQNTGTGIVNNGAKIIIDEGAKIAIEGTNANYVNYTNNDNGRIDLSGKLLIDGNWINNSASSDVFINYGDNAELIFTDANQHEIGGSSTTNFYDISIQNNLSLNTNLTVLQNLFLENSLLDIGNYNLIMSEGSNISGDFSNNNMIIATQDGVVKYYISDNSELFFPIGDEIYYTPVNLNFTTGNYSNAFVAVNVANSKHPENTSTTDYLERYWSVLQEGITNFECEAVFNYVDDDIQGSENNIYGAFYKNNSWNEINQVNVNENKISGNLTEFADISGVEQDVLNFKDFNNKNLIISFYENNIYISSSNEIKNGIINIYNVKGQKIMSKKFINNKKNKISFNGYLNCYLINIVADNFSYTKTVFIE